MQYLISLSLVFRDFGRLQDPILCLLPQTLQLLSLLNKLLLIAPDAGFGILQRGSVQYVEVFLPVLGSIKFFKEGFAFVYRMF